MTSINEILKTHSAVRMLILETTGRRKIEIFLDATSKFYNLDQFDLDEYKYRLLGWVD